jgi:type IV secretory pathway VirB2 component (pilin)
MNTTKTQTRRQSAVTALRNITGLAVALMWASTAVLAQSPWERAAANLETTFTGPLARSLALVAIVLGGPMFMFGEAGAKRQISGIVFGGGLALFAAQFLTWLF